MSERKRVLFLVPALISGGAERVFSTLLRHLDRKRFEIHLAVLQAKGPYMKDVPGDVIVHDLKVSRIRYAALSLIRIIRKVRPDAVLSTLVYLNLQLLLVRPFLPAGTRVFVRESTMASLFLAQDTRYPKILPWIYRHLYPKADRIVCLSDAMIHDLAEHFGLPRKKLVRIYNPLDLEMIRRMAEVDGNPYSSPGPHLVAAGRLSREKGFDLLLDSMPSVLEVLPRARLSILGEGPLEAELKGRARELGVAEAVDFPGFQQNPWRYFKYADVFILPSRYEGLPNALLEALALGVQAVVSDSPGAMQEIEDAGEQMVLVDPESPAALAKAILYQCGRAKALGHSRQQTDTFSKKFSLQEVVKAYSELLLA